MYRIHYLTNAKDYPSVKLQHIANVYNHRYPDIRVSFGYVGDISRWGDDRSWGIFASRPGHYAQMFGGYATDSLNKLVARVESGALNEWLNNVSF